MINRRHGQVMVHLADLDPQFHARAMALWSDGTRVEVLTEGGIFHPELTPSTELHLPPGSAQVFDAFVHLSRNALERIEDVDRGLAELEKDPLHAPPLKVMELKRKVASVREELGRGITALADLSERRLLPVPEVAVGPFRSLEQELLRLREMTSSTQLSLSDLFLIRQTELANQLQTMANRMTAVSNRIAQLANISNIRMLGLSYVTLILSVVATVILFPNTAATILGMPSAANIDPMIVWMVLIGSATAPIAWFVSQKWIRDLFKGMVRYEARVEEGMTDLPERLPEVEGDYSASRSASSEGRVAKPRNSAVPPKDP